MTSLSDANSRRMANSPLSFISTVLPLKSAPLPSSVGLTSSARTPHNTASANRAANPLTCQFFQAMTFSFCLHLQPPVPEGPCPLEWLTPTRQASQRAGAATLRILLPLRARGRRTRSAPPLPSHTHGRGTSF